MLIQLQVPSVCNLNCNYCYATKTDSLIQPLDWLNAIANIPGKHEILLGYGEPSFDPGCMWLTHELLAAGHQVGVITNCTGAVELYANMPDGLTIYPSYHPYHWELSEFMESLNTYRESGLKIGVVNIVAHPPKLDMLNGWKRILEDDGFEVCILEFCGFFNGNEYPAAYTVDEKEKVFGYISERSGVPQDEVDKRLTGGMKITKCRAGKDYMFVTPGGHAYACTGRPPDGLGDIWSGIHPLTESRPCPYGTCVCYGNWHLIEESE